MKLYRLPSRDHSPQFRKMKIIKCRADPYFKIIKRTKWYNCITTHLITLLSLRKMSLKYWTDSQLILDLELGFWLLSVIVKLIWLWYVMIAIINYLLSLKYFPYLIFLPDLLCFFVSSWLGMSATNCTCLTNLVIFKCHSNSDKYLLF